MRTPDEIKQALESCAVDDCTEQDDDEVCRAKMASRVNVIEQDLRRLRIQVFEPMIDWAAMAGK